MLEKTGLKLAQMDVIELNEAFAAQGLAVTRDHGLPDDAAHVNPNVRAIAIGHPLGVSSPRPCIISPLPNCDRKTFATVRDDWIGVFWHRCFHGLVLA